MLNNVIFTKLSINKSMIKSVTKSNQSNKSNLCMPSGSCFNIPECIILASAEHIEACSKEQNVLPSHLFNPLNIKIPESENSWEKISFKKEHFLNTQISNLIIPDEYKGFKSDEVLFFLDGANKILPKIRCCNSSNWPYLFFAQLQIFCEYKSIKPSTAFKIFGINIYFGKNDTWKKNDYRSLLIVESLNLNLYSSKPNFNN